MTGPEHYAMASRLLALVANVTADYSDAPHDAEQVALWTQMATLHMDAARIALTAENQITSDLSSNERRPMTAAWLRVLDPKAV